MTAYDRAAARFAKIATIGEAQAMLGWDAAAMMPMGGGAARGDQLAVLAGLSHAQLTAPDLEADLAAAEPPPDPWAARNLELMRHARSRAVASPPDLVEAIARACSACEQTWRQARKDADFRAVLPQWSEVVRLVREQASCLSAALGLSPYDALMDGFQPGIAAADVAPVFAAYESWLAEALPRAERLEEVRGAPLRPTGPFPADKQEALCRRLAERAGLDPAHYRLDRSAHPFCGGTPTDVRITTRYDEAEAAGSIMGVLHETGHALYERSLPEAHRRQPVGEAAGMAAHESQSLIVEMQASRSDAFLSWLGPELLSTFGGDRAAFAPVNLARLYRRVRRGFIRVDADEMTYPAHVILRFRLEQGLVAGDLAPADLPGAWNEMMRGMLGITPRDDSQGCLQDIHWYDGAFGYFPSYTLGAMAAAQLMAAAKRDTPGLDPALARGDFSPLTGWLREHVHSQGSLRGFNDLLAHATGKPLDPADFEAHLTGRYLS